MKNHLLNIASSVVASTLRGWHGSAGSKQVAQPPQLLQLFDREDDPECRLVREALTELNLDVMIYPCPLSGSRFTRKLTELSGENRLPFLIDPNTGEQRSGAKSINDYLFRQYRQKPAPRHLLAQSGVRQHAFHSHREQLRIAARHNLGRVCCDSIQG